MSYYTDLGYDKSTQFRVISPTTAFGKGSKIWLKNDDNSPCPQFTDGRTAGHCRLQDALGLSPDVEAIQEIPEKFDKTVNPIGVKADNGKLRWTLLPWKPLSEIVEVLMFGANKYPSADNWKHVAPERYKDALLRHITSWLDGERSDKESGKHHLAHAGCCLLFLLWFDLTKEEDVRKIVEVPYV